MSRLVADQPPATQNRLDSYPGSISPATRLMIHLPWLAPDNYDFPPLATALREPNGLLAAGGDLSPERLLAAYRQGIFPWFNPGEPILWWSPDPRTVIYPHQVHLSRSLHKLLRQGRYRVTVDHCFETVMRACAGPRRHASGTWISNAMIQAYTRLHQSGYAHSVEVWQEDRLVGGLYGMAIGRMFFGESMFSRADNASKVGFAHLCRYLEHQGFGVIDCQVANPHLESLGAVEIPREEFQRLLIDFTHRPAIPGPWRLDIPDWRQAT